MSKKFIFTSSILFAVMLATTMVCFAFTLLSKDEALKQVFWSGAQIETETVELTGEILENIKKRNYNSRIAGREEEPEKL